MQLFTVDQANRTLPLVRKIVEDVVRQHRKWRETILELDLVASTNRAEDSRNRAEQLERQAQAYARELDGYQRELEELGIQLKDPRLGLVDYPSEYDGRVVLLCWHLGEPQVQFWHELDAGYAGRQPLAPAVAV
ncbi:MAG TPA: DUF2203 domain-containing protein [Gemmatimonadaceae bacterium]|jgi:hypothetical protein|nr:DUF2203 domain-containing protein [Gemmatimonadaceae bacterium]